MNPFRWTLLLEAKEDFRRAWPQLVLTDLMLRAAAVVVTAPLLGLLVKLLLMRTADGVLTDEEIAVYLLHPIGLTAILVVGGIGIAALFVETGVLMVIGYGAAEERRVGWLQAFTYVARRARTLVNLGAEFAWRLLVVVLVFLAAVGGIYKLLLGSHDINYYLADRPPEFLWAVVLAGTLAAALSLLVLRKFAGWILGLPMVLFEGRGAREALRESVRVTAPFVWRVTFYCAVWLGAMALLGAVVHLAVGQLGRLIIPDVQGNLVMIAIGLGLTLLVAGGANLTVAILTAAYFPLLISRLYRRLETSGRLEPAISERGSLGGRASLRIEGKWLLVGAVAALAAVLIGGDLLSRSFDADDPVAVIAHRGASKAAPENTMASFERAIAEQTDWIELDVQEDANGTVVVAHDSDFMKVARNGVKVWELTDEARRTIDIGSWFAPVFSAERVPTLRQALELARGKVGVVIELKYYGHDQELESRVVEIVEETETVDDVMLMSLKLAGLRKVAALRPDWRRGLLNTASVGDLTRLDLNFLALNSAAAKMRTIRQAHRRGLQVYVWTVDDPIEMTVMISRGADGIITDKPALARRVIEVRQQLSPLGRMIFWIAGETGLLRIDDEPSAAEDA